MLILFINHIEKGIILMSISRYFSINKYSEISKFVLSDKKNSTNHRIRFPTNVYLSVIKSNEIQWDSACIKVSPLYLSAQLTQSEFLTNRKKEYFNFHVRIFFFLFSSLQADKYTIRLDSSQRRKKNSLIFFPFLCCYTLFCE